MPLSRPTLSQLVARNEANLASRLGIGPLLPRSNLAVIARLVAGASHELHGHLEWLARNFLPDQAEAAELERWATILGLPRKAATFAEGSAEIAGVDASVIPTGTLLRRADGERFETTTDATIVAGVATLELRAVLAGLAGNSPAATVLRLVSPISGVSASAEVDVDGITGGLEAETDEELRARVLQRLGEPPQGGAARDYVRWALEVEGVTRAWSFQNYLGLGTVGVGFTVDDDPTGPFPTPSKVAEVAAYIEDGRRPVTAQVFVFAPLPFSVDLTIELTPDDAATRSAVTLQLQDLLYRVGEPGGTVKLSHLREAISNAAGETDSVVQSPLADVVAPGGALPILGTITWV